jgi:hypothetical protein
MSEMSVAHVTTYLFSISANGPGDISTLFPAARSLTVDLQFWNQASNLHRAAARRRSAQEQMS